MKKYNFYLVLFASFLLCELCFAQIGFAVESADKQGEQNLSIDTEDTWEILLSASFAELDRVKTQIDEYKVKSLTTVKDLKKSYQVFKEEYNKLLAMRQVSRGRPVEVTVIEEKARRLGEAIITSLQPAQVEIKILQDYFNSLNVLVDDTSNTSSPALLEYTRTLNSLVKTYNQQKVLVQHELDNLIALNKQVQDFIETLVASKASLWWDYYFTPGTKIFDLDAWNIFFNKPEVYSVMSETLSLRLSTDIPQELSRWGLVAVRLILVFIPLLLILRFVQTFTISLQPSIQNGLKRLLNRSFSFMLLGISMYYAAFSATNGYYQGIGALGSLFFIWGQFCLAWDLQHFFEEKPKRLNHLWRMFPQVIAGLMILYLDMQGILLICTWVGVLTCAFGFALNKYRKTKKENVNAKQKFLVFYLVILFIAFFLTLLGWCRLSILCCMVYVALCTTLQLCLAVLNFANKLDAYLPKEGFTALFSALILALGVPIAFATIILSLFFWFLAYPGSTFLVQHLMLIDLKVGEYTLNFAQVAIIIASIYLTRSLVAVGKSFLGQMRLQGTHISTSLIGPLQMAFTYVLWAICALYILSALGFNLTSLAVVAGGLSVGLGFGLQNIVQNFISGLMVIFGQTIREGDLVEVEEYSGIIRKVHIRSTMLETFDNAIVFIPNSSFLSSSFTNWTHNGTTVRREIKLGIAYGSDVEQAIKLLLEIAENDRRVLKYPEPLVFFSDFADSSLTLLLRVWIHDVNNTMGILSALRIQIGSVFKENNIEIAFPQLDVHFKKS